MKQRLILGILFPLFFIVLSACGGSGNTTTGSPGSQKVDVTLSDFKINAAVTTFTPGKSYHFAVTNNGKTAHEFMIMPKAEGNMSGMAMGDMDKIALAAIDTINPGETRTLDYSFPSSAAGSHPAFACYMPGHYEAGMKQDVTVSK